MLPESCRPTVSINASTPSGPGAGLPERTWYTSWKATADRIVAALLMVLTSPLILLSVLLVKLTSRGPAIYSQTRLGLRGQAYTIYKIRTMTHNCERLSGPKWASRSDS